MDENDLDIVRRKTSMLVYAIEIGMVNYIREALAEDTSYLEQLNFGDLLQEFSKVNPNTLQNNLSRELKHLADIFELATIRNSCAHPVKEFQYFYWYRAAAFAADPRLQQLKIKKPADALACSESGQISDPPEQWLDKLIISSVPNNLPVDQEFDRTGLIGRSREIELVIKDILNGRHNTIALVGPGGVGKTSLAIEVARRLSDKTLAKNKITGLLFVTVKKEYLTSDGLVIDQSKDLTVTSLEKIFIDSISELYSLTDFTLEDIQNLLSDDNILVVLDNMEDVLIDGVDKFEALLDNLPAHWKVLITSRITVDGAKNIPISGLSTGAQEDLARKYYSQVVGRDIDKDISKVVIQACAGNPLALKLIIDRLGLGCEISLAKADVQKDVLEFSFRSLISTLSEIQQIILECIFVVGSASRQRIKELTNIEPDLLSENISRLFKTALVDRLDQEGVEVFVISPPVKDLLARSPLNLEKRRELAKKLSSLRISESSQKENVKISFMTFEPDTTRPLRNFSKEILRIWSIKHKERNYKLDSKQKEFISQFDLDMDKYESDYKKFADFYRLKAMTRALLFDQIAAVTYAKKALEISPNSVNLAFFLSSLLIDDNKNEEAKIVLAPFIKSFLEKIGDLDHLGEIYHLAFVREVFSNFFKAHIWQGQYTEILEFTKNWRNVPEFLRVTFTLSRAASFRRSVEHLKNTDEMRLAALTEAFNLVKYAAEEMQMDIYPIKKEAMKLRDEFKFASMKIDRPEIVTMGNYLTKVIGDGDTVFANKIFSEDSVTDQEVDIPKSAVLVEAHSVRSSFAFAHAPDGRVFFIPFSSFTENGLISFPQGQKLYVWDFENNEPHPTNNAIKADSAKLINVV